MFCETINRSAIAAFAALSGGGRFPHALLLEGTAGIGKETLARQFAAAMLCHNRTGTLGCGVCPSCKKHASGNHPDIIVYRPGGGSRGFHLDYVREVKADAQIKPNESPYKIYILCDIHTMPSGAQNALLKLIEEPPVHVLFILTAQNSRALIGTILSRVQKISLEPSTPACIAKSLAHLLPEKTEDERLEAAARSGGIIGRALEILQSTEGFEDEKVRLLLTAAKNKNNYDMLVVLAAYERNREKFLEFLSALQIVAYKTAQNTDIADLTALQAIGIIDIIERATAATLGNGYMPLVTSVFASELFKILKKR